MQGLTAALTGSVAGCECRIQKGKEVKCMKIKTGTRAGEGAELTGGG